MINTDNGSIRINDELMITSEYTFEDFRKTRFYKNQDGIRIVYLEEKQMIDEREYMVSLFFRNKRIYSVSLICGDEQYSEKNEYKRKERHDKILREYGISEKGEFDWGRIESGYDAKGNVSSIDIFYYDKENKKR